ncbi:MAPEG family protein [Ferrimonas marina]|uniref:Uncharacterized conserved protein, MAPEG superfamily n=1 Tax=Ferrimonas marina TaxID=299255 RepID=A0A1M5MR43_9GAMM|nr:MAPEG family protein [Ferrimonas marina]SHG79864.1 Uncharacterized conserved protein, MAPEG superfamily [Ferrimonas marina]
MSTLIFCLIAAALLPYLAKIPLGIAMAREGGYDNRHPRDQQASLTGFGARAFAAHQNAFESLCVFAPAVLLAIATGTTGDTIQLLAMAHIGFRVVYHVLYLLDISTLRSVIWGFAIGCSFAIMALCLPA